MIDLKSLAHALRWRVSLDESADQSPRSDRPWLYQVAGRHGHVFVQAEKQLAVSCKSNRIKPRLLAVPGAKLIRDGDRECVLSFPTGQLNAVATIIKSRRRRVLTVEQRERLAVAGAKGMAVIDSRRSSTVETVSILDRERDDVESAQTATGSH